MNTIRLFVAVAALTAFACDARSPDAPPSAPATHGAAPTVATAAAAPAADACEHGVQKAVCARCNPGLKPAFVAKNDWCGEHERPESQCVPCHPELAKQGIK